MALITSDLCRSRSKPRPSSSSASSGERIRSVCSRAVKRGPYYSCNPYGQSLLQLYEAMRFCGFQSEHKAKAVFFAVRAVETQGKGSVLAV